MMQDHIKQHQKTAQEYQEKQLNHHHLNVTE